MENILEILSYQFSNKKDLQKGKKTCLLYINNPDGTMRWIWNANCTKPLMLKFYNANSFRAKVFANAIKLVFGVGLQKIVFKKKYVRFTEQSDSVLDIHADWAFFMGTIGPNNKAVLFADNHFYKIPTTQKSQLLIDNEYRMLNLIASQKLISAEIPTATYLKNKILKLSDIGQGADRTAVLNQNVYRFLTEMNMLKNENIEVGNWSYFETIQKTINQIDDARIPKNLILKIQNILAMIDPSQVVQKSMSHGDFTPWNMYCFEDKIGVYDWELSNTERTIGFDYFHFLMQQSILVERKSAQKIVDTIEATYQNLPFLNASSQKKYFLWYLLINVTEQLTIFQNQKIWHTQVDWLLETWNQMLNIFVSQDKRKSLIMDLFDKLQNQQYATIKFVEDRPENLSVFSDIDMVCSEETTKSLVTYLKNHINVAKVELTNKSFMKQIMVHLTDDSILAIDCIWQLKVQNIDIMDTAEVLAQVEINQFGIKKMSENHISKYITYFYMLNNAEVPEKYNHFIKPSEKLITSEISKTELKKMVLNHKSNKGFNYLKNNILYAIDTMRSFIFNQGYTITFSGVDGAGKSTIIENIKPMIEKQLRKKVVVLRHRPSVLPILSVWSKGKTKAHQDTINSLPRQGKNKNILSSLLRFSYYYADYFFGQFYIFFKYIIRGYVVIYDRYYFDFINDSKRSNIVLPKKITKFGYNFLLKPKFNFFLYANPDIILNRKQELSKTTIINLTNEYKNLFLGLNKTNSNSNYEAINNEIMSKTLSRIITTLKD